MDKAAEILRKKGIAKAEKRAERSASQGLVVIDASRRTAKSAAMIELNCETDFVARTDDFIGLAKELGKHAAAHAPFGVSPGSALDAQPFQGKTVAEVVKAMSGKTGEAMSSQAGRPAPGQGRRGRRLPASQRPVGCPGRSSTGLTAKRSPSWHGSSPCTWPSPIPAGITDADVPAEQVERERRIAEEQVVAEGKPENIRGQDRRG